jgi:hypothetical protein
MMHGAAIRQPNGRTWRVDESISRQFLKSKLSQLRVAGDKHQFFELRHCIFGFVLPPPSCREITMILYIKKIRTTEHDITSLLCHAIY